MTSEDGQQFWALTSAALNNCKSINLKNINQDDKICDARQWSRADKDTTCIRAAYLKQDMSEPICEWKNIGEMEERFATLQTPNQWLIVATRYLNGLLICDKTNHSVTINPPGVLTLRDNCSAEIEGTILKGKSSTTFTTAMRPLSYPHFPFHSPPSSQGPKKSTRKPLKVGTYEDFHKELQPLTNMVKEHPEDVTKQSGRALGFD